MPDMRGNVVAILSNSGKANPRAFAEERLGVLASNHKNAGNDAAALRCEMTVPEGSNGVWVLDDDAAGRGDGDGLFVSS